MALRSSSSSAPSQTGAEQDLKPLAPSQLQARVQLVARTLLAQDKAQCVSAEGWQNSVLPAFAMMGVG